VSSAIAKSFEDLILLIQKKSASEYVNLPKAHPWEICLRPLLKRNGSFDDFRGALKIEIDRREREYRQEFFQKEEIT
jgi:hypothetical protein